MEDIYLRNTKIIEWSDPDRFFAGIGLYKANKSNRLIFTGGINPFNSDLPPEGVFISEAILLGIPKEIYLQHILLLIISSQAIRNYLIIKYLKSKEHNISNKCISYEKGKKNF